MREIRREATPIMLFGALFLIVMAFALTGSKGDCTPVPQEPECLIDADCPTGLACVDEACVEPVPSRCVGPEAAACAAGYGCLFEPGELDQDGADGVWGECFASAHVPICDAVGSRSEGWYWADSGELIKWAMCDGELPICTGAGSRSEGWWVYGAEGSSLDERLIAWDMCAPRCPGPSVAPGSLYYDRFEGTGFDNACATDDDCFTGGCSGEVCSADQGVITTCEGLPFSPRGTCGCIDGLCIWNEPQPCVLLGD